MNHRALVQWTVALAGLGLLVAFIVGAASEWAVAGLTAVGIVAFLCFPLALESHRIVSVAWGKLGVKFTSVEGEEAKKTLFGNVASTYAFVHNSLGQDDKVAEVKIHLQDELVGIARANAFSEPVDAADVAAAVKQGTPAERVLAFGVLTGDTSLATVDLLLHGISRSKSGNEQYHALLAAEAKWPALSKDDRQKLTEAIKSAPYVRDDDDRREVAERLGVTFN